MMRFSLSPEEETFRQEVSDFLDRELTDEIRQATWRYKGLGPEGRAFALKLGAKGWLGLGWPKEYGGSGGSFINEYILITELARHEAYVPNEIARLMAGPDILHYGSEELKREFLPRIANGEIEFGLGYTEPQAGSDLMMMEMRAVESGDYFIINGQKTFNTESHYADYHWLAAKTDFEAPRHKSMSLFVVDQRSPGITIRPIWTLGGERTNEVFYDDVRVPKTRLVGERNKGFYYMVGALNYERLMLSPVERLVPILDRVVQYTRETGRNGKLLADNTLVRHKLAQIAIEIEIVQCIEFKAFAMLADGREPDYESGMLKLMWSELHQRLASNAIDILGLAGRLEEGSKWAPLKGEIARLYRSSVVSTIGGGSSEIIRNLTATRGLGLPRM
jgi:alkylation response protein AidB-like acyl-CoA dehydrogenase